MRPMMKKLLVLGATVAGGLYLTSPRARETRARLREAYEVLKGVVVSAPPDVAVRASHAEPIPTPKAAAAKVALHLEHALEHGAEGRARSEQQSRPPNVRMHAARHS